MKAHTHFLPYKPEQIYDLVADVEKYPEFLPWCSAARVMLRTDEEIVADLIIGYKIFKETFRSRVHLKPKSRIEVEYINGPFHHLNNHWEFVPKDQGTDVEFFIDFQFKNSLLQKGMQAVFESAFNQMLNAFEKRAHQVYGES